MKKLIKALRIFALGPRAVHVNIAHEPKKIKPVESALDYLVRTTVPPALSDLRSESMRNAMNNAVSQRAEKSKHLHAQYGASVAIGNNVGAASVVATGSGATVNRKPTPPTPPQNRTVPPGIVASGNRSTRQPLTQPKQEPNLTPIPAIMQELYYKVLVEGCPIKILSQHNGVYSIAISDPNGLSGMNSIYTLGPNRVTRVPATFHQRDQIKVTRLE